MSNNEVELPTPMELPPAHSEEPEQVAQKVAEQGSERNPEFLPPAQTSQNSAPVNPGGAQPQVTTKPGSQTTNNTSGSGVAVNAPAIADDIDLIEKEWVEKAKEIVEKTKENPYLQNKAISEIKADYIKKRYNKEIAKSEE